MSKTYTLWQGSGAVVDMADDGDMQGANGKTCAENFIDHVAHWLSTEPRGDYRIEVRQGEDGSVATPAEIEAMASEIEGILPDLLYDTPPSEHRAAIEDFVGDWLCDHRPALIPSERKRIREQLAQRWA